MKSHNPAVRCLASGLLLVLLAFAPRVRAASTPIWNGSGAGSNAWSVTVNWSPAAVPTSASDVKFYDGGATATASNTDNMVDASFGGTIASLQYGNTNNFHTTVISNGLTLNLTGTNGLEVFTPADPGATVRVLRATIVGTGATLTLTNASANLLCNQGSTNGGGNSATLDMTGLDTFTGSFNSIGLGTTKYANSSGGQKLAGILYLAKTNSITLASTATSAAYAGTPGTANSQATAIDMAYNTGNPPGVVSALYLGLTNVFYVDSVRCGGDKASPSSSALIAFNPAFTNSNPYAYFRGSGGTATSVIKWWTLGDMAAGASGSNSSLGTNDFSNGTVDILVDILSLGRDSVGAENAGTPLQGVLTFTSGKITANTIYAGNQIMNVTNVGSSLIAGIINVNGAGATLVVNSNLVLGRTTLASAKSTGILNVQGGTVLASNITVGATSTNNIIAMNNGTLIVTNVLAANGNSLITMNMTNSVLGLKMTSDSATKAYITNLTTAGATNLILLATNPSAFFGSYPATIHLIKYANWNGTNNFGFTNLPAWATGATIVSNSVNSSVDVVIPTDPRPIITGGPASFSGTPGTNFSLGITNTGVGPFTYQWYYTNGTSTNALSGSFGPSGSSGMTGSTTSNLTITTATNGDTGGYFAILTGAYGSVTSSIAQVVISGGAVAPNVSGPSGLTVIAGQNITIGDSASGSPTPALQWQLAGTNISDGPTGNGDGYTGTATSSLTITNAQYPASQGTYSLIASNSAGMATNNTVLTVIVTPVIAVQPVSLVVTSGLSATFTVTSTNGVPAPAFQWQKGNNPIAGATASSYTIGSVAASDTATYLVIVSNAAGVATSSNVTLTVNSSMSAVTLVPANNATGICYDTPLYITFTTAPSLVTPGFAAIRIFNVTNSTTPVDTLYMSNNTTLQTPYAVNVQQRTIAGDTFYSFPVIITGNTAAIYPHLDLLTSNQTYYVTIDDGVFKDSTGAYYGGLSATNAWKFTTKPTGPASATNLVVATDGSGDFLTVQGAVDSVPANNTTPTVINLKSGFYTEIVDVKSKNNLDFRGQTRTGTFIGYPNNNFVNSSGAPLRAMFVLNGNDCTFENLTITNTTSHGGSQAEAIDVEGTRAIFYNMELDSFQDTFLCHSQGKLVYFQNSLIQGDTDFNWGYGTEFYTNCELRMLTTGGHVTQPRSPLGSNGFSFVKCQITSGAGVTSADLGRTINTPTSPSESIFSYCLMGSYITGFSSDAGTNFCDFADSNLTATAAATLAFSRHLTNGDPLLTAATNATTWLYGWVPQVAPNILTPPSNQSAFVSNSTSFSVSATGMPDPSYQWYDPTGSPIASGTNATLNLSNIQFASAGTYSVVVSNSAGAVTNSATLTVPDRAPVANTATFPRQRNVSFKFLISDLLTNASDPDGDTVSLFSTDTTSTNGATISTNATFVFYLPPGVNPNVTDAFNYTVTDGRGSNTTGLVVVTILPPPTNQTQNITSIMSNPGGSVTVSFAAVPNYTYLVQYATNLPTTNWITISTNVAGTNGLWQFMDLTATNDPMRFYRSALP